MKYDASIVGDVVITTSGKEGNIINVNNDSTVKVRFKGDAFGGDVRRKNRKIKRQNN